MAEHEIPLDEPPHDVLAAEAFAMPAPDPELHHHGPIALPDDPTGIEGPHDVLAAEEFPMPAPRPGGVTGVGTALARHAGGLGARGLAVAAFLVGVLLIALRRSARGRSGRG